MVESTLNKAKNNANDNKPSRRVILKKIIKLIVFASGASVLEAFFAKTIRADWDEPGKEPGVAMPDATEKWDSYNVQTKILEKPDSRFYGFFDFDDGGYHIRQYDGWKLVIAPTDDGGVSVTIDEGPEGRGAYLAKVRKVSKNEIIIEHWPVQLGFQLKKFVLDPESGKRNPMIQSFTPIGGIWTSENCWLRKTRDIPKDKVSARDED